MKQAYANKHSRRVSFFRPDGEPLFKDFLNLGWCDFREARLDGLLSHSHVGAYELCFIKRGEASWVAEGQKFTLSPGTLYMTWPDEVHGGEDDAMQKCEIYWVIFRLDPDRGSHGMSPVATRVLMEHLENLEGRLAQGPIQTEGYFREMLVALEDGGPLGQARAAAALVLLLGVWLQAHRDGVRVSGTRRWMTAAIRRSVTWCRERVESGEPVDVGAMAEVAGLRPSQFRVRFRRETGFAPSDLAVRLRMQRARLLLASGGHSITEVAHALGFLSSQHFATAFKTHFGLSPRAWRQQYREGAY